LNLTISRPTAFSVLLPLIINNSNRFTNPIPNQTVCTFVKNLRPKLKWSMNRACMDSFRVTMRELVV